MKKLLLVALTILAGAYTTSAKELTFYLGDEVVPANGTASFAGYELYDDIPGEIEAFIFPNVFISKDTNEPISLKTVSNYPIQVCVGGQCEAAETVLKENLSFAANKKENLLIDCSIFFSEGEEIELPEIKVDIEAWYSNDASNVTKMTLYMGKIAGVNNVSKDENRIYFVNNILNYKVDSASTITIFNLSGKAVGKHSVKGNGSISLGSLPTGIYLYRVDGASVPAGKFIIK